MCILQSFTVIIMYVFAQKNSFFNLLITRKALCFKAILYDFSQNADMQ